MRPLVKKGDKVGLVCPASPISADDLKIAKANIEALGFIPVIGKSVLKGQRFLAGTDDERAADINAFYDDDKIKAVFAVRGGYGSPRLLKLIDYAKMALNPKPFIGISDITALQNAILAKVDNFIALTGICLRNKMAQNAKKSLLAGLSEERNIFPLPAFARKGVAEGRLVGGCLSLVVGLLGTSYMPDLTHNILVLEDVGDEPYQVDRNLCHLANAGVFDKVSGVIFGNFYKCKAKNKTDGAIEDVINEYADFIPCPVAINFNYGHHKGSFVIPLGAHAEMSSATGELVITM